MASTKPLPMTVCPVCWFWVQYEAEGETKFLLPHTAGLKGTPACSMSGQKMVPTQDPLSPLYIRPAAIEVSA